jgi:Ca-activated chloride channel family protein
VLPAVEPSKYVEQSESSAAAASDELLTVRLRYKHPDADASESLNVPVRDPGVDDVADAEPSNDFRFAAAVAAFGLVLRDSEHKGDATLEMVLDLARNARGDDPHGYRSEFLRLAELAHSMWPARQ